MSMPFTTRPEHLKTLGFDGSVPADLHGRVVTSVYVYPASVRLWHWLSALAIVVLCITGYFIGKPMPTLSGPAGSHFIMGYIRFAHFSAGYVLAIGLIFRVCYAVFLNPFSREIFVLPILTPQWWKELLYEVRWYLFMVRYPHKYVGHNPFSQVAMFTFLIVAVLMSMSGFALYGEGLGHNSWAWHLFGWMIPLTGGSLSLHEWHQLGMWSIVLFVMVHLYAAIREDIMSRQSIVSTMISGFRLFRG